MISFPQRKKMHVHIQINGTWETQPSGDLQENTFPSIAENLAEKAWAFLAAMMWPNSRSALVYFRANFKI